MDNANLAWASMKDQNLQKMEKFHTHCSWQIIGAKAHFLTDTVKS